MVLKILQTYKTIYIHTKNIGKNEKLVDFFVCLRVLLHFSKCMVKIYITFYYVFTKQYINYGEKQQIFFGCLMICKKTVIRASAFYKFLILLWDFMSHFYLLLFLVQRDIITLS